jgi:hypothetical protein
VTGGTPRIPSRLLAQKIDQSPGRHVPEPDREPGEALLREVHLVDVAGAAEDRPAAGHRLHLVPLVAVGQPRLAPTLDAVPLADQEVEVARAMVVGRIVILCECHALDARTQP